MDGRVAMTSVFTDYDPETAGIQIFSTTDVKINSCKIWNVGTIWIPEEEMWPKINYIFIWIFSFQEIIIFS